MKNRLGSIMAAALLVSATTAFGAVKEGQFSLSPVIGGYTFADGQKLDTNVVYGVRGGYNFTKNIGVEALFDFLNTERKNSKADVSMYRFGGEMLYNFMPDSKFVPFVAAGLAGQKFNATEISRTPRLSFDYGAGIKYFLTDAFALRGDIRHIIYADNTTPTYSNLEYTLGALIPFGGVKPVAKPVEPVQEAVQPKAAPAEPVVVAEPPVVAPEPPKVVAEPPKIEAPKPAPAAASAPKASAAQERFCDKPAILAVEFDTNKADIKPKYKADLEKLAEFLKEFPNAKGEISGHTDNVGGKAFNLKLSQRRADSVKQYMHKNFDIAPDRLTAKGFGFSKPIASNKTKQGRAKNRRIEANFSCK
ncbi:MAG: OmpA family protein [Desulfuromonadales bacterium]